METAIPKPESTTEVKIVGKEQAFLLYAAFAGDVERTAHALSVRPQDIIDIAEAGKWNEKLKPILALKKSTSPGDLERGINRALNFVQAHRYRMLLERVINKLTDLTPSELEAYVLVEDYNVKTSQSRTTLNTRPLADLAAALEKCAAMSYQALADTAQDRARRDEEQGEGESSGSIHAAIAKAMSEVQEDKSPAAMLFEAQSAQGAALAARVTVKQLPSVTPYDKE